LGIDFIQGGRVQEKVLFLLRNLRFDNIMDRQERSVVDNLVTDRGVFGRFVSNCQKNYSSGAMTTIDEQMVGFRATCRF
jgi:hypothetical protein